MNRRSFFAGLCAASVGLLWPYRAVASVFAPRVRTIDGKFMANGRPVTERGLTLTFTYRTLEHPEVFAHYCEQMRLWMLEDLKSEGAPIDVWRAGVIHGYPAQNVDVRTGMPKPWEDKHSLKIRTRAGVER